MRQHRILLLFVGLCFLVAGIEIYNGPPVTEWSVPNWSWLDFSGAQKVKAYVVYESADVATWPSAKVAAFRSLAIDAFLKSKNCQPIQSYDPSPGAVVDGGGKIPKEAEPILKACEGKPLPRLVITTESGKILSNALFPDNESAELAQLQKYVGK